MSDLDVIRRIAERGLRISQLRQDGYIDIFQHLLDEIARMPAESRVLTEISMRYQHNTRGPGVIQTEAPSMIETDFLSRLYAQREMSMQKVLSAMEELCNVDAELHKRIVKGCQCTVQCNE